MKNPKLHIYGQHYEHDNAFIVGNREALELLKEAIDGALEVNSKDGETVFAADGEGYEIRIYREEDDKYWENARRPYSDKTAEDTREDAIGPWDLFKKYKSHE